MEAFWLTGSPQSTRVCFQLLSRVNIYPRLKLMYGGSENSTLHLYHVLPHNVLSDTNP